MPWVALAPRWTPPPRPRLRVVKASNNPYDAYAPLYLEQEHAKLTAALANPLDYGMSLVHQAKLQQVEQAMQAQGLPVPGAAVPSTPPPLDSVAQWEKLVTLADAAAPTMQQALTDAFDWPKLPSGVQQSLVQGQVAQALAQMADFGMQQMEAAYIPAFSELTEKLFTDVATAQWPALREVLLQTEIPVELPTKLPDDIMVQRALRYVRQEGLTRAKNLWAPTIEASREVIRVGLAEGKTTPQIARELRQHIGLLPGQGKQLMAYNNGLIEAGTPQAKIDTLTEKFAAKLLRRRTTVIARTETIAALNVAADTFFEAAKDAANLPETALRRFWLITFDSRTCPICRAIPPQNEEGHLFNEPFMTSKGPLLRPPAHPQCRCVVIVRPTIIARPGMAQPPQAPAPPVLPPPVPFPPPLPTPPPKVKKPAKPKATGIPKKPKVPPGGQNYGDLEEWQLKATKATFANNIGFVDAPTKKLYQQHIKLLDWHLKMKALAAAPAAPAQPAAPPAPAMSEQYTISSPSPPWATHPKYKFWEQIEDVDLGTLPTPPPGKLSTGVVMIEDGKVWVYEPKNHFGGYTTAFPKGTTEPHLTHQQNAIKEVFEETGLHAKVTGFLGDFTATTGTTRLYLGHKIGGNPTGFGDETWSVKLLTPADLEKELMAQGKSYPLQALQALKDKGLIPATPAVSVPPLQPIVTPQVSGTSGAWPPMAPAPTPAPPVAPPTPAPTKVPKAKPLKASDKIEEDAAKGELLRDLGGSTGAKQYRGTDGVVRGVKQPKTAQAYEEFLANKLYKELGVDAPEQKLTMKGGKITGVASDWLEGETLEHAGLTQDRARGVLKGFVADVWLMNRDAVGLTMDNIIVQGSRMVRLDNGGSLHFRAQGTLKPADDLTQLKEWQGLQNPSLNRAYAKVFQASGYGTPENIPDLVDQVKALQALRARTNGFADLVPAAPGITAKQRKDLVTLLQKRATLLEEQVGLKAPTPTVDVAAETAALKRYLGDWEYNRLAQDYGPKKPAAMHPYEQVAISAYTGNEYDRMNKPFWTSRDADKRAQERIERRAIIEAARSGLPKLEQSKDGGTYYRGVSYIAPAHLATHVQDGIITLEGFASTSSSRTTAKNFGRSQYLYKIIGHGGSYDVRPLSQHATEKEFLYPPDTKFRILDIVSKGEEDIANPVYYIEEVPEVSKRRTERERRAMVDKAEVDTGLVDEAEMWPDPDHTWTHEDYVADARRMQAEDDAYIPTAEELAMGARFMKKQESASGYNQVEPNAD